MRESEIQRRLLHLHVRIVNSHSAEYRESLDEVLVVLRERQIVELVDQLNDTDYLAGGILDGHAENRAVLEAGAVVHHRVESQIFVSVRYINSLKITFTSSRVLIFSRVLYAPEMRIMIRTIYSLHRSSLRNP